jgi:uncharacterized membrane protein
MAAFSGEADSTRRIAPMAQWLPIGLLTVLVFALRFSQIHQSLIGDEIFTFQDVAGRSFKSVLTTVNTGGENSPPLYFLLAWATAKLGDPTVWIRLPSVVLGAATIPVIYAIGRETVGRTAGLIGAAVVAASPFSLYYGVEARPYATMAFFVALSTLALLRAVSTRSRWWWGLYTVSAAAAAYTHYTSIFVLAVQAAWSLWACRDRLRAPIIANALAALLYVPRLPKVRGKALVVIGALEHVNLHNVLADLVRVTVGYPYANISAIPTYLGVAAVGACVLAALVWLVGHRRQASPGIPRPRPSPRLALLGALALATPVGLLLYSLLVTDLWLARGLYASVPAAALLIGMLLARLPRPFAAVTVTVVLATLIAGTVRAVGTTYARGPFRAMAAYLDKTARPGDPIVYATLVGQPAISVQLHKPHPQTTTTGLLQHSVPVAAGARVYVVLDDTLAQMLNLRVGALRLEGFVLTARRHFAGLFPTDLLTYHPLVGSG